MFNQSGNSLQRDNPVVFNLLIINGICFACQNFLNSQFENIFDKSIEEFGSIFHFKSPFFGFHQLITSVFLHGSFQHILFNMLGLFMFGPKLEKVWGSKRFLLFYLFCGVMASITYSAFVPFTSEPNMINVSSALGASGALMGVLIANTILFPNTEVYMYFIPIPIKIKYAAMVWIGFDLLGLFKIINTNIGHTAHLGGALFGFLLVMYWNKTNKKTFY